MAGEEKPARVAFIHSVFTALKKAGCAYNIKTGSWGRALIHLHDW